MGSLTATVAQRDAYFLKHHDYIHQNEWRFIWIVDGVRDEVLFVEAPEARSFCEPWSNSTQFVAFDKNGRLPPHDDA